MNKEAGFSTQPDRPPTPLRYRLIEYGEPTPLIPHDSIQTPDTALMPTGRYAVVGNSDIHLVTMPLQGEPGLTNGRDWTRPTVNERDVSSYMHFGLRCIAGVARAQIGQVLTTRILIDRDGETLVGVPSASYTILRPGRPTIPVLEWPIDMFYNPNTDSRDRPALLTLPMHTDEMKGWSFRVIQEEQRV